MKTDAQEEQCVKTKDHSDASTSQGMPGVPEAEEARKDSASSIPKDRSRIMGTNTASHCDTPSFLFKINPLSLYS